tara:strand:- start:690 stop:1037 length:348 start_codon:yes stop_codon:yes gene_type:complete
LRFKKNKKNLNFHSHFIRPCILLLIQAQQLKRLENNAKRGECRLSMQALLAGFAPGPIELLLLLLVLLVVVMPVVLILFFVKKAAKRQTQKINNQTHHLSLKPSKTTEELKAEGK